MLFHTFPFSHRTLLLLAFLCFFFVTKDGTAAAFSPGCIKKSTSTSLRDTSLQAKHNNARTTQKNKSITTSTNNSHKKQPLDPQQIASHVSAMYTHGPGGVLRDKKNKAKTNKTPNYIQKLDRHPALVLNADYQPMSYLPLSLWHWQEAVKAVFSGKVTVVDVYQDVTIRAANIEIPLPSVIALNEYVPQFNQQPAFTRRNVFLRDEYRCQYCRQHFHTRDLSLDHVVPRCMGGQLHWENVVTSCTKCNGRKGSRTLQEIRHEMKLHKEPQVPTQFELAAIAGKMLPRKVHSTWEPYLGFRKAASMNHKEMHERIATESSQEMEF